MFQDRLDKTGSLAENTQEISLNSPTVCRNAVAEYASGLDTSHQIKLQTGKKGAQMCAHVDGAVICVLM